MGPSNRRMYPYPCGSHHVCSRLCGFPDGIFITTTSVDRTAKIWNPITGVCLQTLVGHENVVHSCEFSHNGMFLATASWDNTAKIWNPITGVCIRTFNGHNDFVLNCAFSPDDAFLATASSDSTAKIWDSTTGVCLHTLRGHGLAVGTCMFSADGTLLATASGDSTAKIWNPSTGVCLRTLQSHSRYIWGSTFLLMAASSPPLLGTKQSKFGTQRLAPPVLYPPSNRLRILPRRQIACRQLLGRYAQDRES
jgi:WD40 repeat protein